MSAAPDELSLCASYTRTKGNKKRHQDAGPGRWAPNALLDYTHIARLPVRRWQKDSQDKKPSSAEGWRAEIWGFAGYMHMAYNRPTNS